MSRIYLPTQRVILEIKINIRDVQNRFFFNFGSVSVQFLKKTQMQFEMRLVWFKKLGSVWILWLFTTHVIANITATVDDVTLTSLTTTTSK